MTRYPKLSASLAVIAGATVSLVSVLAVSGPASSTLSAVLGQPANDVKNGVITTRYPLARFQVPTGQTFDTFVAKFDAAAPGFSWADILRGVQSWDDVVTNTAAAAPHGFLTYSRMIPSDLFGISGVGEDNRRSVSYLMGNHVFAERMYRHNPAVMLHAPLRMLIYESKTGEAIIEFDRPSDQFGSFGDPRIAAVGEELDGKVADLLGFLGVPAPQGLRN